MSKKNEKLYLQGTSQLLGALGKPVRLEILLVIGNGEACVCHLEAQLGYRQAYISQHLMALREAGVLTTRRGGRFIYYRLQEPQLMDLIHTAGLIAGFPEDEWDQIARNVPPTDCPCPQCSSDKTTEVKISENQINKIDV